MGFLDERYENDDDSSEARAKKSWWVLQKKIDERDERLPSAFVWTATWVMRNLGNRTFKKALRAFLEQLDPADAADALHEMHQVFDGKLDEPRDHRPKHAKKAPGQKKAGNKKPIAASKKDDPKAKFNAALGVFQDEVRNTCSSEEGEINFLRDAHMFLDKMLSTPRKDRSDKGLASLRHALKDRIFGAGQDNPSMHSELFMELTRFLKGKDAEVVDEEPTELGLALQKAGLASSSEDEDTEQPILKVVNES